jgi:hypothetical protein
VVTARCRRLYGPARPLLQRANIGPGLGVREQDPAFGVNAPREYSTPSAPSLRMVPMPTELRSPILTTPPVEAAR